MRITPFQPGLTTPKRMSATKPTAPRFGETKANAEAHFRHAALTNNRGTLLGFLRGGKIDINAETWSGHNALMDAAEAGSLDALNILIEAKANLNAQEKEHGWTAVMNAVVSKKDDTKALKILIDAGADLDLKTKDGKTALMIAARRGKIDALKMLIAAKAGLNHQDNDGRTAIMNALIHAHSEAFKLLIEAGADLNLQELKGNTALVIATDYGDEEALKMLIDASADVTIKNNAGKTPAQIAHEKRYTSFVELLQQAVIPKGLTAEETKAFIDAYNMPIED